MQEIPVWKMDTQEKIQACDKKKQEGNALFKEGKFWLASKKYDKARNLTDLSLYLANNYFLIRKINL